jgi:hypothetical protein
MKKLSLLLVASIACAVSNVYANKSPSASTHPATKEWVLEQLANFSPTSLTAADWAAACTSGTPTGVSGCLGNISSAAFAKLNKIIGAGGFTDQVNIPVTNVPNSIFIQQYNGGSSHVSGSNTPTIHNTSAAGASCAYFSTQGANLDYEGVLYQKTDEVGGGIEYIAPGASHIVYNADGGSSIKVTYYVLCIGSVVPAPSTPTAGNLTGISAS